MKKPALIACALLLAAGLILGVVRLFQLRFERGDVYPPYSTLRTDPLGASVFYESLERLPGRSARRYFEAVWKEEEGRDRVLFVLGLSPGENGFISPQEFKTLQQFLFNGGRVIVAYRPGVSRAALQDEAADSPGQRKTFSNRSKKKQPEADSKESKKDAKKTPAKRDADGDVPRSERLVDLADEWGFKIAFQKLEANDEGGVRPATARRTSGPDALPATVEIHTAAYFSSLNTNWVAVYQRGEWPVVIERPIGKGAVVLAADSYGFSNEAMFKERDRQLLVWMLGSCREAVFEEAHLGVTMNPGVAVLMRKYRLHGLVFGLLLLAALFIWKNSLSLIPPHGENPLDDGGPVVTGKDSIAGFVNLLRRGIPPANILNTCLEEWQKTSGRRGGVSNAQRQEVERLVREQRERPARERNPVEAYRAISAVVRRRK